MSDTPFGFGSREWLGDTPGSESHPEPEPPRQNPNALPLREYADRVGWTGRAALRAVIESNHRHPETPPYKPVHIPPEDDEE